MSVNKYTVIQDEDGNFCMYDHIRRKWPLNQQVNFLFDGRLRVGYINGFKKTVVYLKSGYTCMHKVIVSVPTSDDYFELNPDELIMIKGK